MSTFPRRKISIAFLTQVFPYGGAERNFIDIGTYLKDKGFSVYVFCSRHVADAYPEDKEFEIPVFEMGKEYDIRKEETVWKMKEILDKKHIKIDVMTGLAVGTPVKLLKEALGCKFIYTNQEMPFCRTKYELFWAKERKGLLNQLKARILLPATNNRFIHHFDNIYVKRHKKVYDESDIYTCLCDGYKKQLDHAFCLNEKDSKIRIAHNFESVTGQMPTAEREKVVLFVGRLYLPSKRVDRLLRIWKRAQERLPDWKLVIAGDGMHREYLEKLSVSLGLKRCTFLGWANNVTDLMQKSSILCFTSECEGWPLVLTEAQANGLPVIAFDCCAGVHEILAPNGDNGILIPMGNEKAYSKALIALAHNEVQRNRIANNAFQAVKRYTLEETGQQWISMIESLVKRKE